jgi:hypothetical protein
VSNFDGLTIDAVERKTPAEMAGVLEELRWRR